MATQVAIQKLHYSHLTEKIEESARQRHDLRHHLRIIYRLIDENKAKQAINYLNDYDNTIKVQKFTPLCDNIIIDAILQYYSSLCKGKNIKFDAKLEIPNDIPVEDTDISILFGNLIENSFEACSKQESGDKFISIIGKYKDSKLLFKIENSYSVPVKEKADKYFSSKHDGLGIGTESVKTIVKQNNGLIEFSHGDNIFKVSLMLMF